MGKNIIPEIQRNIVARQDGFVNPELLTARQAAVLLGLGRSTFYLKLRTLKARGMRQVLIASEHGARPMVRFTRRSILEVIERASKRRKPVLC